MRLPGIARGLMFNALSNTKTAIYLRTFHSKIRCCFKRCSCTFCGAGRESSDMSLIRMHEMVNRTLMLSLSEAGWITKYTTIKMSFEIKDNTNAYLPALCVTAFWGKIHRDVTKCNRHNDDIRDSFLVWQWHEIIMNSFMCHQTVRYIFREKVTHPSKSQTQHTQLWALCACVRWCTIHKNIHLAQPRPIAVHVFGRTPMLFTKPPAQKGAVQVSHVQKEKLRFSTSSKMIS